MKEDMINFGKFLLNEMEISVSTAFDWDKLIQRYEQHNNEIEIVSNLTNRPGLVYINWVIANYYNLDPYKLRDNRTRQRTYIEPKQIFQYVCQAIYNYTPSIVGEFYGRDHATAIHSRKTVLNLMETDITYRQKIIEIINKIERIENGKRNERTDSN